MKLTDEMTEANLEFLRILLIHEKDETKAIELQSKIEELKAFLLNKHNLNAKNG